MSNQLKEYKKALQNLKLNNLKDLVHTIDKDKLSKSYKDYQKCVNCFCDIDQGDVDSLIKYEKWLLGE